MHSTLLFYRYLPLRKIHAMIRKYLRLKARMASNFSISLILAIFEILLKSYKTVFYNCKKIIDIIKTKRNTFSSVYKFILYLILRFPLDILETSRKNHFVVFNESYNSAWVSMLWFISVCPRYILIYVINIEPTTYMLHSISSHVFFKPVDKWNIWNRIFIIWDKISLINIPLIFFNQHKQVCNLARYIKLP